MAKLNWNNTSPTTSLSGSINDSVTSLTLSDGTGYPTADFKIWVDSELILVGARSGASCTSLTRGHDGTPAAAHGNGASVRHVTSAEDLQTRLLGFPIPVPGSGEDNFLLQYNDAAPDFGWVDGNGLFLPIGGGSMLGNINMNSSSLTNIDTVQIEVTGTYNMPGPDTDDLWRIFPGDAGDNWQLVQFDDSGGSQFQRIVVFGKGTAVTDEGDLWFKDFESNMLLQWDESDDQWEFYKAARFEATNALILGAAGDSQLDFLEESNGWVLRIGNNANAFTNRLRFNTSDDANAHDMSFLDGDGSTATFIWDESGDNWAFTKNVDFGGNVLSNPLDPTAGTHVGDRDYNDARYSGGAGGPAFALMLGGM